jgi:hypothetical protein
LLLVLAVRGNLVQTLRQAQTEIYRHLQICFTQSVAAAVNRFLGLGLLVLLAAAVQEVAQAAQGLRVKVILVELG